MQTGRLYHTCAGWEKLHKSLSDLVLDPAISFGGECLPECSRDAVIPDAAQGPGSVAAEQWVDTNAGELSEASFSVDRTAQCYGVNVEFRYFQSAKSNGQDVSNEFRVLGKLRLLNVGAVETPSLSLERETASNGRGRTTSSPSDASAPPSSESVDPTRIVRDILRGTFP